jgi:hypothetical protein
MGWLRILFGPPPPPPPEYFEPRYYSNGIRKLPLTGHHAVDGVLFKIEREYEEELERKRLPKKIADAVVEELERRATEGSLQGL